jgi:hypothetical protein
MRWDAPLQGLDQLFPHVWYASFHVLFEDMAQLVSLFPTRLEVTLQKDQWDGHAGARKMRQTKKSSQSQAGFEGNSFLHPATTSVI